MTPRESKLIALLHKEVKPALGCTEPIAVSLAVAKAVEVLAEHGSDCEPACPLWRLTAAFRIRIAVSGNILKNGLGVGIPGTDMIGLDIAAALGAVCGKSAYGLEVLKDLSEAAVSRAKELVKAKKVVLEVAETPHLLYIQASVCLEDRSGTAEKTAGEEAISVIQDDHDKIVETRFAGKVLETAQKRPADPVSDACPDDYDLTVREIYDFTIQADDTDIAFILEGRKLNLALAVEGLKGNYGLGVGKAIRENQYEVFGDDFMSFAMGMTAAASDARMAGCKLPAMSNSGSGNQGITVSMPVIAYAMKYGVADQQLARALIMSNLVAIHIKHYLGKLSALCGCVIASTGSACGLVYLQGGSYEQVCAAIKNMIGNITGMVCDGAKVGCAMKVASGVSSAVQSCVLALRGTCIQETDGIIDKDIEKTIRNLGRIGSFGMRSTDRLIQEIMLRK